MVDHIPDTSADMLEYGLGGDKPYLGTLSVTEGVVREFLAGIIDLRNRPGVDQASMQDGMRELGTRLQSILYGEDTAYSAGPWNSERHLGQYLVSSANVGGETSDAIERISYAIAGQLGEILQGIDIGVLTEEQWTFQIDILVEFWTHVFMGLPVPTPDDEE